LIVLTVLFLVDRRYGARRPKGILTGVFAVLYFSGRFFVEFFKEFQRLDPHTSFLTMGQYLSLPFILAGVIILYYALRKGRNYPEAGLGGK
jgi:prolipoprotein diacylglyceryltransferase